MLLFADNFAYYGANAIGLANMLSGPPWLEAISFGPEDFFPLAGAGTTFYFGMGATVGGVPAWRVGLPSNKTTLGFAKRLIVTQVPSGNDKHYIAQFRDGANAAQCTLNLTSTGALQLRTGDESGAVIATSAPGIVVPGSQVQIEMRVEISDSGSFELRVNGGNSPVINALSVDTKGTASAGCESIAGRILGGELGIERFTDIHIWDTSNADGAGNNTFLGDVAWELRAPGGDTAVNDFVPNTGLAYAAIDDAAPDGDATYIQAATAGQKSEFTKPAVSGTAGEIVGVVLRTNLKKPTAGVSSSRQYIRADPGGAGDAIAPGATRNEGTGYSYIYDAFGANPSTGVRFTPGQVNGSRWGLEKMG